MNALVVVGAKGLAMDVDEYQRAALRTSPLRGAGELGADDRATIPQAGAAAVRSDSTGAKSSPAADSAGTKPAAGATDHPAADATDLPALTMGALGLCGEAGEFADLVKKHLYQGHPLDRGHLKKELGDVAWYLAISAEALDLSLSEVLQANIDKLKARYPEGFAAERSRRRRAGDK